ncbi:MAG: threonine synthase [Candidatus Lambdaproteobacteria bacterium RIFOXYD1_FULL_56_27]|uniref:Threonine synthase n=1 Tax=Candidatus Lambdaproteobacteria bacterium RIFOXYD2_FULL_56_26 TaxID=1817773 RepID=A0A1F6H3F4_9PROT|nr:MAG: threonine synthase [Candidatus Lambdaproteobacteria bacterium RIFOXYC1_FULL_56_13]OGH04903.1 MAG: threonine synthase [Candidatus Lambdaproteobacteria bacterium RIFOXYD2_FULL_56_26]OGH09368.1 MAG: threonine synthase [Candidatus Lambdaproteobacteria bacterium RIFOXYD1_FULL_56_27]
MRYRSTRGLSPDLSFSQVVLEGLARDGGLYLPESLPQFGSRLSELSRLRYQDLGMEIFTPFMTPDFNPGEIAELVERSCQNFEHREITPLVKGGDHWILELWHGPTLAFKDVALQFLGNLFEVLLKRSGGELNILGATSGDTGSAAIHGVRGKERVRIFILHPQGKVSQVQERQMTSVLDDNVVNVAVTGTFDDAQSCVKEIFSDLEFKDHYHLGAINSINWARVMAQIVYYFYGYFRWQEKTGGQAAVFSVPTGNFGDIFAGILAKRMGLPIKKLVLGTNENDILSRAFQSGDYSTKAVVPTISPSMDIQLASNFERYLYFLADQNPEVLRRWMEELGKTGAIKLEPALLAKAQAEVQAFRVDRTLASDVMNRYLKRGSALDPHTAVGVGAAELSGEKDVICLSTAHPAKFSEAFEAATGQRPKIPASILALEGKPTRVVTSAATKSAIQKLMTEKIG